MCNAATSSQLSRAHACASGQWHLRRRQGLPTRPGLKTAFSQAHNVLAHGHVHGQRQSCRRASTPRRACGRGRVRRSCTRALRFAQVCQAHLSDMEGLFPTSSTLCPRSTISPPHPSPFPNPPHPNLESATRCPSSDVDRVNRGVCCRSVFFWRGSRTLKPSHPSLSLCLSGTCTYMHPTQPTLPPSLHDSTQGPPHRCDVTSSSRATPPNCGLLRQRSQRVGCRGSTATGTCPACSATSLPAVAGYALT